MKSCNVQYFRHMGFPEGKETLCREYFRGTEHSSWISLLPQLNSHSLKKIAFNSIQQVARGLVPENDTFTNWLVHCRLVLHGSWSGGSHHRLVLTSAGLQVVQDALHCHVLHKKGMQKSKAKCYCARSKAFTEVAC